MCYSDDYQDIPEDNYKNILAQEIWEAVLKTTRQNAEIASTRSSPPSVESGAASTSTGYLLPTACACQGDVNKSRCPIHNIAGSQTQGDDTVYVNLKYPPSNIHPSIDDSEIRPSIQPRKIAGSQPQRLAYENVAINQSTIHPSIEPKVLRPSIDDSESCPSIQPRNIRPSKEDGHIRPSKAPKPQVTSPATLQTNKLTELQKKLESAWKTMRNMTSNSKIYENQEAIDMQLRRKYKGRKHKATPDVTISEEVSALARTSTPQSTRPQNQYADQPQHNMYKHPADVSRHKGTTDDAPIKDNKGRRNRIKSIINRLNKDTQVEERPVKIDVIDGNVTSHPLDII